MADIELEKTLTDDEYGYAIDRYEGMTGWHWISGQEVESQTLWIAAFEKAKEYYAHIK